MKTEIQRTTFIDGKVKDCLLQLAEVLEGQGHCESSLKETVDAFAQVASGLPLTGLDSLDWEGSQSLRCPDIELLADGAIDKKGIRFVFENGCSFYRSQFFYLPGMPKPRKEITEAQYRADPSLQLTYPNIFGA